MKPYDELPHSVEHDGKTYELDMSYPSFFIAADILQDEHLTNVMRVAGALDVLVTEPFPIDVRLLKKIFDLVKSDKPSTEKIVMDIEQDWEYICGAFQQAYGIDLYSEKKMHIIRFLSLLRSVPKSTKLAEIISIRSMDIPEPNKYNAKEIAEITKLKTYYRLKGNEKSINESWGKLFEILEMRAKHG